MIKIVFTLLIFIFAAAISGAFAMIIYRQKTLSFLKGYSAAGFVNKIKDALKYIKGYILALNRKFTLSKRYARIEDMLSKVNLREKISRESFAFFEECSALAAFLLCLILMENVLLSFVAAAAAFFVPCLLLKSRIAKKKEEILKEMPDSFDIIAANIEGGLSLNMAMNRYAVKSKSGFAAELLTALKKVQLGKSFEESLREMDERLGIKEISLFVSAFIQADKMGGNIKEIIKNQSEEIRKKRFQYLKKKAYEAPVKLLIPLLIFIFPVIFIVLFGPIVIKLMAGF